MARQEPNIQDLKVPVEAEPRGGRRRACQSLFSLGRLHRPHLHTEEIRTSPH